MTPSTPTVTDPRRTASDTTAQPQGGVALALNELNSELGRLETARDALAGSLADVLREPTPPAETKDETSAPCSLASRIGDARRRLQHEVAELLTLTARLDL